MTALYPARAVHSASMLDLVSGAFLNERKPSWPDVSLVHRRKAVDVGQERMQVFA